MKTVTRLNVTLPTSLVFELRKRVPKRARSKIVAEAVADKLAKMKRDKALKYLAGTWDKAGGIRFKKSKELISWRKDLWAPFEARFNKK